MKPECNASVCRSRLSHTNVKPKGVEARAVRAGLRNGGGGAPAAPARVYAGAVCRKGPSIKVRRVYNNRHGTTTVRLRACSELRYAV